MESQAPEARPGNPQFNKSRGGSSAHGTENFWFVVPGQSWAYGFPHPCCSDANRGVPFPRTGTAASLGFSDLTGSEGIWGGAGTISKSTSLPKGCGALRKGRRGQQLRWGETGFQPLGWKVTWRGFGAAAVQWLRADVGPRGGDRPRLRRLTLASTITGCIHVK